MKLFLKLTGKFVSQFVKIGEPGFETVRVLKVSYPICYNQIDVRENVGA